MRLFEGQKVFPHFSLQTAVWWNSLSRKWCWHWAGGVTGQKISREGSTPGHSVSLRVTLCHNTKCGDRFRHLFDKVSPSQLGIPDRALTGSRRLDWTELLNNINDMICHRCGFVCHSPHPTSLPLQCSDELRCWWCCLVRGEVFPR